MSPKPVVCRTSVSGGGPATDAGYGRESNRGMTGRGMTFQFGVNATGSMGWKFRFEFQRPSWPGRVLTRKLFCWKLMDQKSLAGLVSFLFSSVSDSPPPAPAACPVAPGSSASHHMADENVIATQNRTEAPVRFLIVGLREKLVPSVTQ